MSSLDDLRSKITKDVADMTKARNYFWTAKDIICTDLERKRHFLLRENTLCWSDMDIKDAPEDVRIRIFFFNDKEIILGSARLLDLNHQN